MKFSIRKSSPEDASIVIELLNEFAEYENIPTDEVKLTKERFRIYGFGELKCFDCDIGFADDKPISYTLYSTRFSGLKGRPVIYLEDLFVSHEHRKNGFGKMMLMHTLDYAKSIDCEFVEWVVSDKNTPAQQFYKHIGATLKQENIVCRISSK